MKHKLENVRGYWLAVHEPRVDKTDKNKIKFKAAFGVVPNSPQHISLKNCIHEAARGKWQQEYLKVLEYLANEKRMCFTEAPPINKQTYRPYDGMENLFMLNAASNVRIPKDAASFIDPSTGQPIPFEITKQRCIEEARPVLLDIDMACLNEKAATWKRGLIHAGQAPAGSEMIRPGGRSIIHSGAYYNVILDIYAQDSKDYGRRMVARLLSMQKVGYGDNMDGVALEPDDYEDYSGQIAAMNANENPLTNMFAAPPVQGAAPSLGGMFGSSPPQPQGQQNPFGAFKF